MKERKIPQKSGGKEIEGPNANIYSGGHRVYEAFDRSRESFGVEATLSRVIPKWWFFGKRPGSKMGYQLKNQL